MQLNIAALEKDVSDLKLKRERNKTAKSQIELVLKELELKIKEYDDNKEAIENLEKLIAERDKQEKDATAIKNKIATCEQKTHDICRAPAELCRYRLRYLHDMYACQRYFLRNHSAKAANY